MPIIDTHNHLYFSSFEETAESLIKTAEKNRVTKQILVGCDEISNLAALNLNKKHPDSFRTVIGLHPCDVDNLVKWDKEFHQYLGLETYKPKYKNFKDFFSWLETLYLENKENVVGFGETGFDQFHREDEKLLEQQIESFYYHLSLCEKYKKTLMIHSRSTTKTGLEILENKKNTIKHFPVIWHCFSDGTKVAKQLTNLNIFLGIGGVATYPKSTDIREAIASTPIEFLITETDSPFLTPHKARKSGEKINNPSLLGEVVQLIADIKNLDLRECEEILYKNGLRAFGLTP